MWRRRDQSTGKTHLCSHLTLNPQVERAQAQGQVGVNLACPEMGTPPILSEAAFRLGRGMHQITCLFFQGMQLPWYLALTGGHSFKGPHLSRFKSPRSPQFSPSPKHLTLSHGSVFVFKSSLHLDGRPYCFRDSSLDLKEQQFFGKGNWSFWPV